MWSTYHLLSWKTIAVQLDKSQEIVLFCQSGQRSELALDYLKKEGFTKLSHLEKGIESIKIHLEIK